jgi:hypothetical protein
MPRHVRRSDSPHVGGYPNSIMSHPKNCAPRRRFPPRF